MTPPPPGGVESADQKQSGGEWAGIRILVSGALVAWAAWASGAGAIETRTGLTSTGFSLRAGQQEVFSWSTKAPAVGTGHRTNLSRSRL